ncbi:drug/metabolite transporter (DMT)-like permease [Chitinivorax tropicus]|uniref:Drug/metabolite transporter (DMT)-like permease n=1 Tax=Chitinivorax tropicus TaxID=714531 RepID=A0A840MJK0_9PROT|nr:EamA family transporter [Chitinivorax tropicus]MBB5017675.1 drug/metabolite transporter (DMT)-like permease [Chitinivorax tropicus]
MSVGSAYLAIVFIWSTTALGIRWSVEEHGFLFGVASRMTVALVLIWAVCWFKQTAVRFDRQSVETYAVAGLTQFLSMMLTYWGAQFIPSGLIAVLYGTGPIWTGLFASWWLSERFTRRKLIGLFMGLAGLSVIHHASILQGGTAWYAVVAVLVGAVVQALATVWVKRIGAELDPFSITAGSLTLGVPLYVIAWWSFGQAWPDHLTTRTALAIAYMAVVASVIGFSLFFYLLKHMQAGKVALIQLITPVTAMLLGQVLNGEPADPVVWAGTALIILGLGVHQYASLRGGLGRILN